MAPPKPDPPREMLPSALLSGNPFAPPAWLPEKVSPTAVSEPWLLTYTAPPTPYVWSPCTAAFGRPTARFERNDELKAFRNPSTYTAPPLARRLLLTTLPPERFRPWSWRTAPGAT